MEIFDQITEMRIEPDGKVTVTDVPAEEMENTVANFVRSAREFREANSRPDIATDPNAGIRWWRALEYLALADSRLKECFCGRDRSPVSVRRRCSKSTLATGCSELTMMHSELCSAQHVINVSQHAHPICRMELH